MVSYADTEERTLASGMYLWTIRIIGSGSDCELCFTKVMLYPIPNLFLRNILDPQHNNWPPPIIPIRSPRKSASSMKCVVRMIILSFL